MNSDLLVSPTALMFAVILVVIALLINLREKIGLEKDKRPKVAIYSASLGPYCAHVHISCKSQACFVQDLAHYGSFRAGSCIHQPILVVVVLQAAFE